jgi:seryl-tRNA(Sec) selenium transferase
MNENFISTNDDRKNNLELFVMKVNRLILLSRSRSLKEFVTKRDLTSLSYDQISKPILKNYSFNKKTLQYEWDSKKGPKPKSVDLDSTVEQEISNSKKPKNSSLTSRRLELRKEHSHLLSNRRNIKSYTIVGPLSEELESIVFDEENISGFENMSISDLVNLAVADFIKNYT